MKKINLLFVLIALVIITCTFWFFNSVNDYNITEIAPFIILIVVLAFALFIGLKRFKSAKRGEPIEDELSKKLLIKASSVSFYFSIYLWLFIMYYSDKTELESHTIIGMGIFGMSIIFAIAWAVIYLRGIKND